MMTIEQARESIGCNVTYARHDDPNDLYCVTAGPEYGVITSVNERYVFVRYGLHGAAATDPADLTLDHPDKEPLA